MYNFYSLTIGKFWLPKLGSPLQYIYNPAVLLQYIIFIDRGTNTAQFCKILIHNPKKIFCLKHHAVIRCPNHPNTSAPKGTFLVWSTFTKP